MNVLIVDDEEHVREGIELSIDWAKFGITERHMAENGMEALEKLKSFKPAVLFCDMKMPVMGGIELLDKIREEGLNTQVVVISGYGDFEYTRATIKANGVDYILKPFRRKDVEEALQKAIQAWREKSGTKQIDVEQSYLVRKADEMVGDKKLAAYFRGEAPFTSSIRQIAEKRGLAGRTLKTALILPKNRMKILSERFMMDEELFSFAVDNVARYTLGGPMASALCRLDDYQWLLVMDGEAMGAGEADHRFYLERLKRAWQQTLRLEVLIGASAARAQLEHIHTVIGEARARLLSGDVLSDEANGTNSVKASIPATGELPQLMNEQFLLKKAIESGNKPFATELLRKHVHMLRSHGTLQLKELQVCTMEANLLLGRWSQLASIPQGMAQSAFLPMWINDLDEWERVLIGQVHLLIDHMTQQASSGSSMEEIKDYLDSHFHEDVSLSRLAEQFHFSPQYISKKFKVTYHKTIVTYLTDLKMERAKALLSGTDMPIAEIANQLGYDDENYFSKVFKKHAGMSPFPYRKRNEIK
ncbi:response regulator [Paenibacillus sp. NPDC056579]|uniref:response regulator transcription factor n=1 Tax=Paenibacillus sp. NPDC056579 TaxID=3345871 RepID=UPI0036A1707B